jgi:hypothetical protein
LQGGEGGERATGGRVRPEEGMGGDARLPLSAAKAALAGYGRDKMDRGGELVYNRPSEP